VHRDSFQLQDGARQYADEGELLIDSPPNSCSEANVALEHGKADNDIPQDAELFGELRT